MSIIRKVIRVIDGRFQTDGAGVHLQRVIANHDVYDFDPFLMLDAFDSKNPEDYINGFPWHPHRGIETVTYLISGQIEHMDSLGNKGIISDHSCQWMTAGSGILHQEMPLASEHMFGFQLWVNLPRKDKMTKPEYRDLTKDKIPQINEENAIIKLISGKYKDVAGATQGNYVDCQMFDIELNACGEWSYQSNPEHNLFIFIMEGNASFKDLGQVIGAKKAVLFDKNEMFFIKAESEKVRFVLFSGKPLQEPIAWGGPIVMNTKEELHKAFEELEKGTFIKK